jgi:hypothetical protein
MRADRASAGIAQPLITPFAEDRERQLGSARLAAIILRTARLSEIGDVGGKAPNNAPVRYTG